MTSFFVIALVLALGIANFARQRYEVALQRGRRPSPLPQTAAQVAREFLDSVDASDVKIVQHNGFISDYFDPKRKCLFLHRDVMQSKTEAAWAIALHEAAHAAQMRGMMTALDMRLGNIRLTRYAPALAGLLIVVMGIMKRPPLGIGWKILALIWAGIMLLNMPRNWRALSWNGNCAKTRKRWRISTWSSAASPGVTPPCSYARRCIASPVSCLWVAGCVRSELIPVHLRINSLSPGIDAAVQVGDVAVAVTAQPHGGVVGAHAMVTIDHQVRVLVRQPLGRVFHEP
jgi:Zn-dependent membrane protease YugP